MKKFLSLAILILLSVTARAQYIDGVPQSLERRAGHLYTDDGTRLSQAAAMSLLSETECIPAEDVCTRQASSYAA